MQRTIFVAGALCKCGQNEEESLRVHRVHGFCDTGQMQKRCRAMTAGVMAIDICWQQIRRTCVNSWTFHNGETMRNGRACKGTTLVNYCPLMGYYLNFEKTDHIYGDAKLRVSVCERGQLS